MAKLGDGIFKAHDIRGIYPKDLDETTARAVGSSFGEYLGRGKRIAVSRDVRLSSDSLMTSLLKGLSREEPKIADLGITPTPVISFALKHYGFDGGVMVTASHNPSEWNGFKLYTTNGRALSMESGLGTIKEIARQKSQYDDRPISREDVNKKTLQDYERFLLSKISINNRVRVAVDPGNGSYCAIAKRILERAGVEVIAINDVPDGRFPGRDPEPKEDSLTELGRVVVERKMDFGVGFDADGDRGIFVDDKGRVIRGDFALTIFVKNLLKSGEKAVYTASCSNMVEEEIKKAGGIPIMTKVGRTFIAEGMEKEMAIMGGEIAGHTFFSDIYNIDDPLFATLKMAELIANKGKSLAALFDELPRYKTRDIELKIDDSLKFKAIDQVKDMLSGKGYRIVTLDGVKVMMDNGWFILRASNTTPVVRLVAEAGSENALDNIVKYAMGEFRKAEESLQLG